MVTNNLVNKTWDQHSGVGDPSAPRIMVLELSLEDCAQALEAVNHEPEFNRLLVKKFDQILQLEDGWYDGQGLAPDKDKLAGIIQSLAACYPQDLPLPFVAPSQDGDIVLEWDSEGFPSLDVDISAMTASFHAFGTDGGSLVADFDLGDAVGFTSLIAFLSRRFCRE